VTGDDTPITGDGTPVTDDDTSITGDDTPVTGDGTPVTGTTAMQHRGVLVGLVAMLVAVAGAGFFLTRGDALPPPKPDIPLDAWAPYWALDGALPEFEQRAGSLRDVSPFWFNATGVNEISVDPNARDEELDEFLDIAERAGVKVVPSIIDAMPAGEMAAILADPTTRTQHVEAIRSFAADGDVAGIDIDYEQFAFADGRDTWATTRPNWVAFITELGAALRADGRTLAVSIPPVYDADQTAASGFWVYDYGAIAPHVDRIRIMAYDFSVGEPGPIAPLDFVERSINGALEATGDPEKLVLGLAAYGRNWPVGETGVCPVDELQGRTSVTARSVDALQELRGATPVFVPETGESTFDYDLEVTDGTTTCVQGRRVHFVDGDGVRLRMDLARKYQLNGVSLWALGFEDDAVWDAILPTVSD
jgi:spore germination protein YaaH